MIADLLTDVEDFAQDPGLFGVPESPEREKKKSFLARIGDMPTIPEKARNDRNEA